MIVSFFLFFFVSQSVAEQMNFFKTESTISKYFIEIFKILFIQ